MEQIEKITNEEIIKLYNEAIEAMDKLKSVKVSLIEREDDVPYIKFSVLRYHGYWNGISEPQLDYLRTFTTYISKNNLRKMNKYAASALITFFKEHNYGNDYYHTVCTY